MNLPKIALGTAALALILSVSGIWIELSRGNAVQIGLGAVGGTVSPAGVVLPNPTTYGYGWFKTALETDGELMLGGSSLTTGIDQVASVGSCNSGVYAASTTQFSVLNPFSATSTVSVDDFIATGQSTSTALYLGTTTQATGATATTIGVSLLNAAVLATSSQAVYLPGQTTALGSGQVSPGTGTFNHIVVGPSERITLYSTSTFTSGADSSNYVGGITCTYKLKWTI